MPVRLFLILFLGGFATISMLSCRENTPVQSASKEVVSIVVVADASSSMGDATTTSLADLRCSEVAGIVQQHIPQSKRLDVLVLASGGRATANEPRILVPWLRFAPTFKQFGSTTSKAAQAENFLTSLVERCRKTLVPENSSPIVSAVGRGALSLTSHCAELPQRREACSSRYLVLVSDLRENIDSGTRERLIAVSKALRQGKMLPVHPRVLPTITLEGNLSVCGLSEHVAGKDDLAVSPEAVAIVWRELFNRDVNFEATCPRFPVSSMPDTNLSGGAK